MVRLSKAVSLIVRLNPNEMTQLPLVQLLLNLNVNVNDYSFLVQSYIQEIKENTSNKIKIRNQELESLKLKILSDLNDLQLSIRILSYKEFDLLLKNIEDSFSKGQGKDIDAEENGIQDIEKGLQKIFDNITKIDNPIKRRQYFYRLYSSQLRESFHLILPKAFSNDLALQIMLRAFSPSSCQGGACQSESYIADRKIFDDISITPSNEFIAILAGVENMKNHSNYFLWNPRTSFYTRNKIFKDTVYYVTASGYGNIRTKHLFSVEWTRYLLTRKNRDNQVPHTVKTLTSLDLEMINFANEVRLNVPSMQKIALEFLSNMLPLADFKEILEIQVNDRIRNTGLKYLKLTNITDITPVRLYLCKDLFL